MRSEGATMANISAVTLERVSAGLALAFLRAGASACSSMTLRARHSVRRSCARRLCGREFGKRQ